MAHKRDYKPEDIAFPNQVITTSDLVSEMQKSYDIQPDLYKAIKDSATGTPVNSLISAIPGVLVTILIAVAFILMYAKSRNEELAQATRMAEEAERQKTLFMQNVSHQIRTPLNIIMGFSQVLCDTSGKGEQLNLSALPEEERSSILSAMKYNASLLNRMVMMLFDSSDVGLSEELGNQQFDHISCNEVAREAISNTEKDNPGIHIAFHTAVADDCVIETKRLYLMRSLKELLYNAVKYSD